MGRVIAIVNQKGGVGKTTLSMNLATHWLRGGQRVAVLDSDPQRSSVRWQARGEIRLGRGQLPQVRPCADGAALEDACRELKKAR